MILTDWESRLTEVTNDLYRAVNSPISRYKDFDMMALRQYIEWIKDKIRLHGG
jgi:hypothetical protein